MGWFESQAHPGVMLGDDAFDRTHEYLKHLANLYRETFERPPTLEEVRVLLETGLAVSGGEVLDGFEERRVTSITIKTAKKPKDQRYKAGDIFAIPLEDSTFAIGRIMMIDDRGELLIEVFQDIAKSRHYTPAILESGRLLPLINMGGGRAAFQTWRWTVIGSDGNYTMSKEDLATEFVIYDGPICRVVDLKRKMIREVQPEAAKKMNTKWWTPEKVEQRIKEELQRKPKSKSRSLKK